MTHSQKDARGGHAEYGVGTTGGAWLTSPRAKRWGKKFNRREARREAKRAIAEGLVLYLAEGQDYWQDWGWKQGEYDDWREVRDKRFDDYYSDLYFAEEAREPVDFLKYEWEY